MPQKILRVLRRFVQIKWTWSLFFLSVSISILASSASAQTPSPFLYLPFRVVNNEPDYLDTMTSVFDHNNPNFTRSDGKIIMFNGGEFDDNCVSYNYSMGVVANCGGAIQSYDDTLNEFPRVFYNGHNGYDWAVVGDVLAAAGGEIVFVGWGSGYSPNHRCLGYIVVIDHNNDYRTVYGHLKNNSSSFTEGDPVQVGQKIGEVGNTTGCGTSTGTHLHFQVEHYQWQNENWHVTDPFGWIGGTLDPLAQFNGESSRNLWVNNTPTPYGGQPGQTPAVPTNGQYMGGALIVDAPPPSPELIAHFADGRYSVTSQQQYYGLVTITISGIGQASGTQYSDAFYLLTDYNGNPIEPVHPTILYNWVLWINGQHAENLIPDQQVPSYRGDQTYTFEINAPGGYLTFGVGDVYTSDNFGSYTIQINTSPSGSIPFFSQRDPRWINHALLCASGTCSTCNTIGTCGSTLTSAAMLFASYGANLTPPALSDCMGTSAYPFDWSVGASCSNDHAIWVNRYPFSWTQLDQELNQNGHPVLLGMHYNSDMNDTHWVFVTSGYGTDASNYLIHDPWPLDGAGTNLNVYARQGYVFDWISVYDNDAVFSLASQNTNQQGVFPAQTKMLPDQFQAIATATPDTAIGVTPIPKAIDQTMPESSLSNSDTIITTSSAISGSVLVYHVSETAVTIQLAATSTVGDITEMQVWTDSNPTSTWQVFDTFAWLPWTPGDQIYARFRDNLGSVSDIYSDSIRPVSNPPSQIFLPIILKSQ